MTIQEIDDKINKLQALRMKIARKERLDAEGWKVSVVNPITGVEITKVSIPLADKTKLETEIADLSK